MLTSRFPLLIASCAAVTVFMLVIGYRAWIPITQFRLQTAIDAVERMDAGDPTLEQVPLLLDDRYFVRGRRLSSLALWGPTARTTRISTGFTQLTTVPENLLKLVPDIMIALFLVVTQFGATWFLLRHRVNAALRRLGVAEPARVLMLSQARTLFCRQLLLFSAPLGFAAGVGCSLPQYLLHPNRAHIWHVFPDLGSLLLATSVLCILVLLLSSRSIRLVMPAVAEHPMLECTRCGYDLSSNSTSTCPECGQDFQLNPPKTAWLLLPHRHAHRCRNIASCVALLAVFAVFGTLAFSPSLRASAVDGLLARQPRQHSSVQIRMRPEHPIRIVVHDQTFLIEYNTTNSGFGSIRITPDSMGGSATSPIVWHLDAPAPPRFAVPGHASSYRWQLDNGASIASAPTMPEIWLHIQPVAALRSCRFVERTP
jgi:hypothetical protein